MDRTTVQIKLVAVADIHLKQGEEIDVEIVIPMEKRNQKKLGAHGWSISCRGRDRICSHVG
jgi:hypothetical protein